MKQMKTIMKSTVMQGRDALNILRFELIEFFREYCLMTVKKTLSHKM